MAVPTRVGPAATSGSGVLRQGLLNICSAAGTGPSTLTSPPSRLGVGAASLRGASAGRASGVSPPVPPLLPPVPAVPPPLPPVPAVPPPEPAVGGGVGRGPGTPGVLAPPPQPS